MCVCVCIYTVYSTGSKAVQPTLLQCSSAFYWLTSAAQSGRSISAAKTQESLPLRWARQTQSREGGGWGRKDIIENNKEILEGGGEERGRRSVRVSSIRALFNGKPARQPADPRFLPRDLHACAACLIRCFLRLHLPPCVGKQAQQRLLRPEWAPGMCPSLTGAVRRFHAHTRQVEAASVCISSLLV